MKIGVDIDNVTAELTGGFCEFYKANYGGNINIEDFEEYWLYKVLKISKEENNNLWDEYYNSRLFEKMQLMDGAKEAIISLNKNHEIVFITSRKIQWKDKTIEFIKKSFPNDNFQIIFSGDVYGGKCKEEICKEMGINLIIEDHHEKSLDYANAGMQVILFERPWNRKIVHDNFVKVKSWGEILEKIR